MMMMKEGEAAVVAADSSAQADHSKGEFNIFFFDAAAAAAVVVAAEPSSSSGSTVVFVDEEGTEIERKPLAYLLIKLYLYVIDL